LKNAALAQEDEVIHCFFAQQTMKSFNVFIRARRSIRNRHVLYSHDRAQPKIAVTSVAKALFSTLLPITVLPKDPVLSENSCVILTLQRDGSS
jgi:hypothetical protein